MARFRKQQFRPLIDRKVRDENFAHVVSLVGASAACIESIEDGQKVDHNLRNCLQIVAEVAVAFIAREANGDTPLTAEARRSLEILAQFRAIERDRAASLSAPDGESKARAA